MMKKVLDNKLLIITLVLAIVIIVVGTTYAWFTWTSTDNDEVTFAVEGLDITYNGDATIIKETLYPTASMTNPDNVIHEFSLVATANTDIYSKFLLEIITFPEELNHESFRYDLYKGANKIASGSFATATEGEELLITPYERITTTETDYTLYIWIDGVNHNNPTSMGNKSFTVKLKIDASQESYVTDESCFTFDETTGTITDYLCYEGNEQGLFTITDVVIPETINGVNVTKIGNNSLRENGLTSVVIPNGVITIGSAAFFKNQLTSVIIPDSVTSIGAEAFWDNQLISVIIPDGVEAIEIGTFQNNKLISVTIPDSVTTIGNSAFYNNQLKNVAIPNSVTTIGSYAFYKNILTSLNIPNRVTSIGAYAFCNNDLTNLTLSNSIVNIDSGAFADNNLTSVIIPNSLTSISSSIFYNNKLVNVVIPDSVTSIGKMAFQNNKLINVVIPHSVTIIEENAFRYNCLTSVYVGANSLLTNIGQNSFANQSNNGGNINIYNNSGKAFDWNIAVTGTAGEAFETGSVTGATITTGGNP